MFGVSMGNVCIPLRERIFSGGRWGSIGPRTEGPLCATGGAPESKGLRINLLALRFAGEISPLEGCRPPLTLTEPGIAAPFPPEVLPAPPLLSEFPPVPPFVAGASLAPPGAPGRVPSGDMATRAERLPCGTLTSGVGAAGAAEIAMRRWRLASPEDAAPTSGATVSSRLLWRSAAFDSALSASRG